MIQKAIGKMELDDRKILIIENVGNLVCPAGKQIGQDMDLIVSSTTEGSDKPKKYPIIFMDAKVIVISKADLADAVGFDEEQYLNDIKNINPRASIHKITNKSIGSIEELSKELLTLHEKKVSKPLAL